MPSYFAFLRCLSQHGDHFSYKHLIPSPGRIKGGQAESQSFQRSGREARQYTSPENSEGCFWNSGSMLGWPGCPGAPYAPYFRAFQGETQASVLSKASQVIPVCSHCFGALLLKVGPEDQGHPSQLNLRPHPRPAGSEPAFSRGLQVLGMQSEKTCFHRPVGNLILMGVVAAAAGFLQWGPEGHRR